MSRLTDNDYKFGPFTYGRSGWKNWSISWSSGGDEDRPVRNYVTIYAFNWVIQFYVWNVLKPYIDPKYKDTHENEYGISIHDGALFVRYGPQTHDSSTTKMWCYTLPWKQWRLVRYALYDKEMKLAYESSSRIGYFEVKHGIEKVKFDFLDYDGAPIEAETCIEQREWKWGEGWFKWLSLFRPRKIRRSLDIALSAEMGPEKGSWKGGTVGTGVDMLPGENHEQAFTRWCGQEHRDKGRYYQIQYVGKK